MFTAEFAIKNLTEANKVTSSKAVRKVHLKKK
jgi:hypothetical protein